MGKEVPDMPLFTEMEPTLKKALGMAERYLSQRWRSIWETKNYLSAKGFDCLVIDQAVEILIQEQYLDDRIFAGKFLESRRKNKPKSTFALRYELVQKRVSPAILDPLLAAYNDLDLAFLAVKPKIPSWQHLEKEVFKKKMFNFLSYRGFSFSVSFSTWQRISDTLALSDPPE